MYIEANIRGGGEYGPKWHQTGEGENWNKAYEYFIIVGEDVVAKGFCKPETLGVKGGSNGGLLVGMMMVGRGDLFGAICCQVPLLDLGRYNLLVGWGELDGGIRHSAAIALSLLGEGGEHHGFQYMRSWLY